MRWTEGFATNNVQGIQRQTERARESEPLKKKWTGQQRGLSTSSSFRFVFLLFSPGVIKQHAGR
jgi:hypothetical protein